MPDCFVGIDPGLHGGVAVLNADGGIEYKCEMPVQAIGKRKKVDGGAVHCVLYCASGAAFIVIEKQQPFPKQGGVSNFTTGRGYGALETVLEILNEPWEAVRPQVWKKAMGVVGTGAAGKRAAAVVARRLWPHEEWLQQKNPHDGMVDALLIAEYARRLHVSTKGEA